VLTSRDVGRRVSVRRSVPGGLTDVVGHGQIADALAGRRRPQDDCQWLVDLAQEAKSEDDVTVLVADYSIRPPAAA